ncbi:hypothetical protein HDU80_002707, partial [Chytriomyces hyalinus]
LAIYSNKCKRLMFDHAKGYVTRTTSSEWRSLYMTGAVKANMHLSGGVPFRMHNFGLNGSIYFRGEKGGLASQVRKDASRKVGGLMAMSRRMMGKKGKGYMCVLGLDARDVATIEAGPKWEGPGATKALFEMGKILPKALLDIFLVMHNRLGNSLDALSKLAVPGLAIYRDKCKRLKLDHMGGYVTHVVSSEWMTLSMSGCVIDKMALFVEAWVLYNESLTSTASNAGEDILQLLHKRDVENDVAEIQRQ